MVHKCCRQKTVTNNNNTTKTLTHTHVFTHKRKSSVQVRRGKLNRSRTKEPRTRLRLLRLHLLHPFVLHHKLAVVGEVDFRGDGDLLAQIVHLLRRPRFVPGDLSLGGLVSGVAGGRDQRLVFLRRFLLPSVLPFLLPFLLPSGPEIPAALGEDRPRVGRVRICCGHVSTSADADLPSSFRPNNVVFLSGGDRQREGTRRGSETHFHSRSNA